MIKISPLLFVMSFTCLACGDASQTTGTRLRHSTQIALDASPGESRSGWSVTPSRVVVAVGALHFFNGEALTAEHRVVAPNSVLAQAQRAWQSFSLIGVAHAHPGHYVQGDALGEMLVPQTVELGATAVALGAADAVSGDYRSGRFSFGAATGELSAVLDGDALRIEGTARREGTELPFVFRATLADLQDSHGEPVVEGCAFSSTGPVEEDGEVLVTLKSNVWFSAADFSELSAEEPLVSKESKLFRQIRDRVTAAASIELRYQAP